MSGPGSRHTLQWFCQPWFERLISWLFTRYSKLTFFLVWRFLYIVSEVRPPSLMMRGLFGSSWWLQVGGRAIITLWAADRDRGRWLAIIPVLSLCRRRIVGGDLPPSLSFRPAGGGSWAVAGCRNDVARLAYFSQWSGQTYPDRICRSSGCDVCECRVLFPKRVRIGEACHMSSWGVRMEFDPDINACHVFPLGEVQIELIQMWSAYPFGESGWSLIRIAMCDTCPTLGSPDGVDPDIKAWHVSLGGVVPTGLFSFMNFLLV